MRRQRMWQLKYRSGSPTDMNVSSSKEGWGTSLLKYINKKFTNLRGKCKEIQLHGETNTIQCQVFQHGERTCRQLCAGAAHEVGPVRHSSHPVRLHRWQVWSPQASRPQHLWALSGTGAISNKCWWWFTRCCSFCHFGDSVVYMFLRGYWQILGFSEYPQPGGFEGSDPGPHSGHVSQPVLVKSLPHLLFFSAKSKKCCQVRQESEAKGSPVAWKGLQGQIHHPHPHLRRDGDHLSRYFWKSLQVSFIQLWTPDIFIENLKDMRGPDDTYYFVKPVSMYVQN